MDKVLKITFIFGILIVSLSVAYYFIFYIPQKDRVNQQQQSAILTAKQIIENKEKCVLAGEKLFKKDQQQYNTPERPYTTQDPEYAFNSKLNTCLYKGGYTLGGGAMGNKLSYIWWVKDSLSNKEILYEQYSSEEIGTNTNRGKKIDDFFKKAEILMQNN